MSYQLLKPIDISQALGVSRSLVYKLLENGEIRAVRIGKCLRVRPEDIEAFLDEHISPEIPKEQSQISDSLSLVDDVEALG